MKATIVSLFLISSAILFSQNQPDLRGLNKSDLRKLVIQLDEENKQSQEELESLKTQKEYLRQKLNRIAPIKIDEVINFEDIPIDVSIGDGGWRIESNSLKYKADLIGQLGSIWVQEKGGKILPQGSFSLSDFDIEPKFLNPDKEVIFKKFISKGTTFKGDGGMPFIKLKSKISNSGYSKFTINIEGTSEIMPTYEDIVEISKSVDNLFDNADYQGVYICTGMHVIKYKANLYSKTDVNSSVSSPVVLIDGEFYAESSDEYSEYLVVRQLTELNKQANMKEKNIIKQLDKANDSPEKTIKKSDKLSPQQILFYMIGREPKFNEIVSFMGDPKKFAEENGFDITENENHRKLIDQVLLKSNPLPNNIASDD